MKGGLVARDGTILHAERRPTPRAEGPDAVVAAVSAFVTALTEHHPAPGCGSASGFVPGPATGSAPRAVGPVVPGLVTPARAVFSAAFGWRDVPAEAFTDVDLPVALGHDVRAAGEAELAHGLPGDAPSGDVLFVPIGTGIAGAVALSGSLYGGASGWAGQIGHIPVRPGGLPCGCGQRGCLSAYASAGAVAARCGETSAEEVLRRVRRGDAHAGQVWDDAVETLALALATYTLLLLDPELVVVGGGLSLAGPALIGPLRDRLAAHLAFRRPPRVRASRLGPDAGLLGAALLAWRAT